MCEKKCRVSVRLETQPSLAGGFEIRANTGCCRGVWIPLPGGGGGAFLPLAGGVMDDGAIVNFFSSGLQSSISATGWLYQDGINGGISVGFDVLAGPVNNVLFSPIDGRVLVNDGVQQTKVDADYEPGKTAMLVDDSSGNVKITLLQSPLNLYPIGTIYRVKKMGAAPKTVEIAPNSGSIEGVGSIFLTVQNESVTIVRSGNNSWNIV